MNYKISDDLKLVREMINMSQEEMANNIGVQKRTIIRIERGENYPSEDTLEKFYNFTYKKGIKLNSIKEMFYKEENPSFKIIFHGARDTIEGNISPFYGRENNDFGKGFYCGVTSEQASSFISRFPNSSMYMIKFNGTGLKKVDFDDNQEWMLAIAYYCGTLNEYGNHPIIKKIVDKVKNADYIYAPIVDNRMYRIIEQFIDGYITDEQCKHCLAATNLGKQFVFLTEKATSNLEIIERCYLSASERDYYHQIKQADINDSDNKVKLSMIKYKNQGKYIEEILG
jgi:transcriptional regulator with XRE-family HTH domain